MAIEDDDKNNDVLENQNDDVQDQQQDEPTLAPKSVDAALEKFVQDSSNAGQSKQRQTPVDPNAPKLGADGKPLEDQSKQPVGKQPVQDQQVRGTPQGTRVREFGKRYYRDAGSNIVDRETGKIVAKAGAPYAVASAFLPHITKLEGDLATAATRLKAFEDSRSIAQKEGLSLEEDALGTRLMVAYKKDPVATIKYLLTQAQEQGKDVTTLTGGQTFDPSSIINSFKEQIAEAMKPFQFIIDERTQSQQQREAEEEARTQAQQEVQEFTEQFPDATVQDAEIGALMTAQGWTMREAYFALKAHAAENRLDWSKPIGQQIAARRAAPNGGGQGNRRTLPQMNVRGGGQQPVRTDSRAAAVDDDYGSIIKDIFAENGIEA